LGGGAPHSPSTYNSHVWLASASFKRHLGLPVFIVDVQLVWVRLISEMIERTGLAPYVFEILFFWIRVQCEGVRVLGLEMTF
jgi:hypothetical protein